MNLKKFPSREELDSIRNCTYGFKELDSMNFKESVENVLKWRSSYGLSSKNEYNIILKLPKNFIELPILNKKDVLEKYLATFDIQINIKPTRLDEYVTIVDLKDLYKLSKRFNLEGIFFDIIENSLAGLIRSASIKGKNTCTKRYNLPEEDIIEIRDAISKRVPNNYIITSDSNRLIIQW